MIKNPRIAFLQKLSHLENCKRKLKRSGKYFANTKARGWGQGREGADLLKHMWQEILYLVPFPCKLPQLLVSEINTIEL